MTDQTTQALSRRAFLQAATAALLSRPGRAWSAGPRVPVEDWRATLVGSTGVPPGWQKYETPGGHPAYDFTVVEDAGRRALHMKSAGEHSTIAREVQADLAALPILAWQWRVLRLPQGADLRNRATSDVTGHIFAVWPRFPAFARSRLIGYVWDPTLPVGTVIPSRKTGDGHVHRGAPWRAGPRTVDRRAAPRRRRLPQGVRRSAAAAAGAGALHRHERHAVTGGGHVRPHRAAIALS